MSSIKGVLEDHDLHPDTFEDLFKLVTDYTGQTARQFMKLAAIGTALSAESDMDKILEMILDEARELTGADAGTLYTVNQEQNVLDFAIMHNSTMDTRMGGTSGVPINLPPVPLTLNGGQANMAHVSAFAANTRRKVHIDDVYTAEEFDFTGPRKYDQATGYRTQSMLVIPMLNHENEVIGVLQLLNSMDDGHRVIPFAGHRQELATSLASQAAVTLTNTQLIHDLKQLFYSFIKSIATAIDAKSPYTSGHIRRVVELTMMIAESINADEEHAYAGFAFTADEMEELKIAAWMHDVGKIATPEHIVDKATRLETVSDGLELINTRYSLFRQAAVSRHLEKKLAAPASDHVRIEQALRLELEGLDDELSFIRSCNNPNKFMEEEDISRITELGNREMECTCGKIPCLTASEVEFLTIKKGTLTIRERSVIENHALMTQLILDELPFPKKMANAPVYASQHHEKPDGTGYPNGKAGEELALQARILAVADIFEALTASDRPYKPPISMEKAVMILENMKKQDKIDKNVFELFIKAGIHEKYREIHLEKKER